jgi:hypothetical protein
LKGSRLFMAVFLALALAVIPSPAWGLNAHPAESQSCDTFGGHTYCLIVFYDIDCNGWIVTWYGWYSPDGGSYIGGSPLETIPPSTGAWNVSGVYESYAYNLTLRLWITYSEYIDLNVVELFEEPAACVQVLTTSCPSTNQYYMYAFRDENQPATWQEYCYIISSVGYPSADSQARICSVAGSDHSYRATALMYSGWVYKDCNGLIHYGWPDWDPAWFKSSLAP